LAGRSDGYDYDAIAVARLLPNGLDRSRGCGPHTCINHLLYLLRAISDREWHDGCSLATSLIDPDDDDTALKAHRSYILRQPP
jgi:hypothetical protein